MSNYLAIATVTAALQRLLQTSISTDVPGANVTTLRPDNPAAMSLSMGINVYLYQVTPNPAWRNADLRTRRPKGDLIKHGQAGLDLHYLLTFYGNEQELEPQRLMGSAIKTLVDQPTLTQKSIRETIANSNLSFLARSTLDDQSQVVQFIPSSITTEDLSRIWSVFFQVPYTLSFAYQGMAVLIEGDKPGSAPLPIRRRQFIDDGVGNKSTRPVIEQVDVENTSEGAVTAQSRLIIKGRNLWHSQVQVQIGAAQVTPQEVSPTQVVVDLSALSGAERRSLRAGVQGIQIIHLAAGRQRAAASGGEVESNVEPLVLCPTISRDGQDMSSTTEERDEDRHWGDIAVTIDMEIAPTQRVFLILNGLAEHRAESYIFRASRRSSNERTARFPLEAVAPDRYLVRVQIDGAESPLWINDNEEYADPTVVIP
ncbi:DUF4255 domain-containing protein [Nodosilinea sp. LEGE 07088]|uniref:DUF4255 domain-containing protein n=1 Tax=Nodosilinea sp. LEGE 07088 TaxID=2777968 RepID=UPI0018814885|nr:DUF4255 domain-containing protein [Nodosilinea sp. LEGE 07088]MBE9140927.1 DUF4255 domain-containing protein [Nodosilinea sp. LEGE 07088]